MKFKVFILLFLFLLFFASAEITGDSVTGEIVTGEATSNQFSMSINVIMPGFSLSILSPENETYISNLSLPLDYYVEGEDSVWHNFDNGLNLTVPSSFSIEEGFHTLYLFANNSLGNILSDEVSFRINLSKFFIDYDSWFNDAASSCNDFNKSSFEDLQSLNHIFFENQYGKINFSEPINLTDDSNFSDSFINLDDYLGISANRISVDLDFLPNFNKAAVLELYGLNFINPRILKDGVVCSECSILSYSGGNLVFSGETMGVYSVEETPSESGDDPASPSSGPGGTSIIGEADYLSKNKISLDKDFIKIVLKQGETVSRELTVKNDHSFDLNFSVEVQGVKSLIKLNETLFGIGPNKDYTLNIDFLCPETVEPNVYFGKLIIKTGSVEKEVNLVIEVESKSALFDVEIIFPKQFEEVRPGDEITFVTKLINLGEIKRVDVVLNYVLKDFNGKDFVFETDSFAVETQASHPKTLTIPENLPAGDYLIYVRLDYKGSTASASHQFKVKPLFYIDLGPLEITLIILIIIVMVLLIVFYFKSKKRLNKEPIQPTLPKGIIDEI